jgi:hypothetical protein
MLLRGSNIGESMLACRLLFSKIRVRSVGLVYESEGIPGLREVWGDVVTRRQSVLLELPLLTVLIPINCRGVTASVTYFISSPMFQTVTFSRFYVLQ